MATSTVRPLGPTPLVAGVEGPTTLCSPKSPGTQSGVGWEALVERQEGTLRSLALAEASHQPHAQPRRRESFSCWVVRK